MKKFFSLIAAVLFAGSMMAEAITCAEARERALAGEEAEVTVKGFVTEIAAAWSSQYKNVSFWMADEKDGGQVFQAFRAACETAEEAPTPGALVEVTGTLKKYNDIPELAAGCTFVILEPGDPVIPEESDADVVLTSEEFNGLGTSGTGSEVKVEKDGITFLCDKGYGDQYGVRCYKNSNVTISSSEKQIGKIVFEFATVSGTYYNGGLDEEVCANGMEWKAESLESQARMNKVSIYFGSCEPIDPPVVELDTVSVAEAVEIGMALADNAKTEKDYVVAGWVVQAYAPNEGYTDQTWFMADEQGAYGEFEAYRCTPDYLVENDQFVYVKGKIQKYVKEEKTQIEIGNGTATHGEPQGIENVVLTEDAQKVVVDGVVYVVRDNKMFNLQGAQVR